MEFDLEKVKENIKNYFTDENGKPKTKNVLIFTGILVIIIILAKAIFKKPPETQEEAYSVNVEYNLPEEKKPSTVRIGTNADLNYITKGEMEYALSKQFEEFTKMQTESITIALENAQEKLLRTILTETEKQTQKIERKYEQQLSKIENEIESLRNRQVDYEKALKNIPYETGTGNNYSTYSSSSSSYKTSSSTTNTTKPYNANIPTNDYKGNSYQSEFIYNQPIIDERIRTDSGFIVNAQQKEFEDRYIFTTGDVYESGIRYTNGIPAGNLYNGLLVTGAVSSKEKCPVIVQLKEDILIRNKVVIPKDTRLIGYAITDYNTRQIYFDINRLILNDREIKVKASLVNKDGTPGFCSKYIDKTNEVFWKTIALNFVSTMLQSFKDITYFVTDQGIPVKTYDDTTLNTVIDASSAGLISFSEQIMRDAQAMGAIILVNPNIEVKIMLEEYIPIEKLM